MCARQGDNYRGNNIDLKKSTLNCSNFLGYYPLMSLSNLMDFEIEKTLKETIKEYPEICKGDYIIIPLYHPVAQIKNSEQLEQYKRIWKYID